MHRKHFIGAYVGIASQIISIEFNEACIYEVLNTPTLLPGQFSDLKLFKRAQPLMNSLFCLCTESKMNLSFGRVISVVLWCVLEFNLECVFSYGSA
jgi:hypothetical protein